MSMVGVRPLPRPGLAWGPYPQRQLPVQPAAGLAALLRATRITSARLKRLLQPLRERQLQRFARRVRAAATGLRSLDQAALTRRTREMRVALGRPAAVRALQVELFALASEHCRRTLDIEPWAAQIIAARIMLDDALAEMATGEGKTLAIGLAAAAAALSGIPVHVLTANDYLVERDQTSLKPFFDSLGLSSGHVLGASERQARRAAYACDIVYVTAREVAFDYLRDRLATGLAHTEHDWHVRGLRNPGPPRMPTLLRGLCMAIVDEADSQLLDEAVTPLILAQAIEDPGALAHCRMVWDVARTLWINRDFALQPARRRAELTESGCARLDALRDHGLHHEELRELVQTALAAIHLLHRDVDYVVANDCVTPIDEPTGRLVHGRQWSRGLHQMVEIKEGLPPGALHSTAARIDFQTLFSRYVRLAGMSGTLRDAAGELAAVYRLRVLPVAPRSANRRVLHRPLLFGCAARRWDAVLRLAAAAHAAGRPVLITAESMNHLRVIAQRLTGAGLAHRVLHAGQAADEAAILRAAGRGGALTIATNIAGRGADIVLDDAARAAGGLLVLVCQLNRERRLDRQLYGRCARAGEPGEVVRLLALDDDTLHRQLPRWLIGLAGHGTRRDGRLPSLAAALLLRLSQSIAQARQRRARLQLIIQSRHNERLLALAGPGE